MLSNIAKSHKPEPYKPEPHKPKYQHKITNFSLIRAYLKHSYNNNNNNNKKN